jgi:aldehyde:ferredoxin oxidoreductase
MSFYDWKRGEPRLKQAGRGGLGSVMMDKRLKAIVARSAQNRPQWQMTVEAP